MKKNVVRVLVSLLMLVCMPYALGAERQVTVIFRFDDFASTSDTELETALFELFAARQMALTVGVIPSVIEGGADPRHQPPAGAASRPLHLLTSHKADLLRTYIDRGTVEAALHGYTHELFTESPHRSEFIGMPADTQAERVTKGKEFLEAILETPIITFIPPFNGYDRATVRACEQAGLRIFSAGMWGPAARESSMHFIPSTCGLDDLEQAINAARRSADDHPVVVVLFHETDFLASAPGGVAEISAAEASKGPMTLADMRRLLDFVAGQADVKVMTLAGAVQRLAGFDAARYAQWVELRELPRQSWQRRLLPPSMWQLCAAAYLHVPCEADITAARRQINTLLVAYWLLVFCAWALLIGVGAALSRLWMRHGHRAALAAGACLLALCWLLWLREQLPEFKHGFLVVGAIGCLAGTVLAVRLAPPGEPSCRL